MFNLLKLKNRRSREQLILIFSASLYILFPLGWSHYELWVPFGAFCLIADFCAVCLAAIHKSVQYRLKAPAH